MKKQKLTYDELVEKLKSLFDAVPVVEDLSDEHLDFLDERNALERRADLWWSFDGFVDQYDNLKAYGLEEKLMAELEIKIRWALEDDKEEFLKSRFYRRFQDHDIVARAVNDYS
jgi:hypothetical protein